LISKEAGTEALFTGIPALAEQLVERFQPESYLPLFEKYFAH
jgi:hypothetical protein